MLLHGSKEAKMPSFITIAICGGYIHKMTGLTGWRAGALRRPHASPGCGQGNAIEKWHKRVALDKEGAAEKQCLGEGKL